MSDIRCPNCGKDNPDFLDACQFCQTPLTPASTVHIGDKPTKKNTGELEPILPEWLRDMRQQGRDSMEDGELSASATKPRVQKNEAPDLLAGLASQGQDDDDEIPDWLASINPVVKPKASEPPAPEPANDFFAQFNKSEPKVEKPAKASEPAQEQTPSWMGDLRPAQPEPSAEKDDLSEWFSSASQEPSEPFAAQPSQSQDDSDWMKTLNSSAPAPEEKEDLSWLHNLEASARQTETPQPKQDAGWDINIPSTSSSSGSQEDLSWLNALGDTSQSAQPSKQEDLSWLNTLGGISEPDQPAPSQPAQQEDLGWLNALGGTAEPVQPAAVQPSASDDLSWLNTLGGTTEPEQPALTPPSSSQDDLGWLNTLGGTSEPAQSTGNELSWLDSLGGVAESATSQPADSAPSSSHDDLSWLNEFSGTSEPSQQTPAAQEDLSWLNTLGGSIEPAEQASMPSTPQGDMDWLGKLSEASASEGAEPAPQSTAPDELDWLKNFAGTSSEPETPQLASTEPIELGWLDNLGETTEEQPAPAASQESPDWLRDLGDPSSMPGYISAKPFGTTEELNPPKSVDDDASRISPFVPRRTAPLGDAFSDDMPDWLKSATQETPDLPLGAGALDQFRDAPRKPADEIPLPSTPEPDYIGSNVFSSSNESRSFSNQDVDSLFSMDMPDWLSKPQPDANDVTPQKAETPAFDASLSPVELPSWVQAMRPVESVLSETGPSIETQPTEKEGPLAGLRGVIPSAPIGSSRRPKAISLKLQASDEQQAGTALFEQILAGESAPRTVVSSSAITSQRTLRIALSVIFWVVLGGILFMRSQIMPVSSTLPLDVSAAANAINAIPSASSVLVVVDYEPSLAGEMEAVSVPVLKQLILAHQPNLVFLATSANSAGLVERMLSNAGINTPEGLGYTLGEEYVNLGYLPGGSAGIMGFMTQPNRIIPSAAAQSFSEYSAVILLTDHAESGRAWVEQLDVAKQTDSSLASQSLILVTSAQAGPLLQPYVSSKQAAGMVNGLSDAARFEYANALPPEGRIARNYWDAFGVGILMAIVLIIFGSVWSLVAGIRARRASGEQG